MEINQRRKPSYNGGKLRYKTLKMITPSKFKLSVQNCKLFVYHPRDKVNELYIHIFPPFSLFVLYYKICRNTGINVSIRGINRMFKSLHESKIHE